MFHEFMLDGENAKRALDSQVQYSEKHQGSCRQNWVNLLNYICYALLLNY